MSRKLDFNFYVAGLKTAIINLLKNGNPSLSPIQLPMTGVRKFAPYGGELNSWEMTSVLKSLASDLPAVLVAYGSGKDRRNAATGTLADEPIEFEHSCGFVVIVACNNFRLGGEPRATTAERMAGEARQLLGGVQFEIDIAEDGQPEHLELLNHTPLIFAGVETLLLLSDLTALAVSFTTSFKEFTPNRRVIQDATVDEILLDMGTGGSYVPPDIEDEGENIQPAFNLPGIVGEVKK